MVYHKFNPVPRGGGLFEVCYLTLVGWGSRLLFMR